MKLIYNETYSLIKLEMISMDTFMVSITKEDKFFISRCSELGVTSQSATLDEAQANIKESIELYIESFGTENMPMDK